MMIEVINLEEQLEDMKAKLDKFQKESAEKDAQIKRQNEHIAELEKKLEKKSFEASNEGLSTKDSNKESSHSEECDDKCKPKKDCTISLMSVE